jgi:hypothetical protein
MTIETISAREMLFLAGCVEKVVAEPRPNAVNPQELEHTQETRLVLFDLVCL